MRNPCSRLLPLALLAGLWAATSQAQDGDGARRGTRPAEPTGVMEPIDPEAFLDLVEGRTVEILDLPGRSFHGREEFLDRSRTRYVRADGSCLYGEVTAQGPAVCYYYEELGAEWCWWMFREGDRILGRTARLSGASILEITGITDEPVACEDVPSV